MIIGDSMKLNNKGFAFSTMLYGTLALITVVLFAILSIQKSSIDSTYYYGEAILSKLNECVTAEVELENCYSSASGSCDGKRVAYENCLGIMENSPSTPEIIISETLKSKVNTGGLIADSYVDKRYIYAGATANNYLEYSGKIWRIISIEPDGTLRLLDSSANFSLLWDSGSQDMWGSSTLYTYLNNDYLSGITDISKVQSGMWIPVMIYPSASAGTLAINEYMLLEESESTLYAQVGLPSIVDYMKANNTDACKNGMLGASSCTSWLSEYASWTYNINAEQTTGYAYYFDNAASVKEAQTNTSHRVYPVIILNRNSVIISGDGTVSNPYVLK